MKKYFHIWFFVSIIIVTSCNSENKNIVAWINNQPVTKSELKHWMLLEKANVFNYFYQKYGTNDSDIFWTQKLGNEVPLEKLKEIALKQAKRCKVQQILALEKGIIKTTNFDEIIAELEKVNAQREKKVKNGEPVYGPVQFTTRTYFFHVFDKMKIELKNELSKNELKPGAEELRQMQKSSGQNSKVNSGFLSAQYVDKTYDKFVDKQLNEAHVKINNSIYKKISLE